MNNKELSNINFNLNLFANCCDMYEKYLIPGILENIKILDASAIIEINKRFDNTRHQFLDSLDGDGVDIAEWPKDLIDKYLLLMDKAKAVNDFLEQAAHAADALNVLKEKEHELQRL